jgi:F-type H+-transporting ATPase subunit a
MIQIPNDIPSVGSEVIFRIGHFPISNSMLLVWLITILILVFSFVLSKKIRLIPRSWQNIIEVLYESMENLLNQITGDIKISQKIFPLIASLFIFIGLSNLITLIIPFLGSFTYQGVSIFRTPTADFNTTLSLALAMVLFVQFESIRRWGFLKHLSNYFQFHVLIAGFKKGFGEGFIAIINFLVGLLDIVSEIAKVISLSFRLFGNMYAGEVLATILLTFLAYILPSAWMAMNLLSGVIQAMVFGSLTAAYYTLAIKSEESENI